MLFLRFKLYVSVFPHYSQVTWIESSAKCRVIGLQDCYMKRKSQASCRHTATHFFQWPLRHLNLSFAPFLIPRVFISCWHLSPFIAYAGVSLAFPPKPHTPRASEKIQNGTEEGRILSSCLHSCQWLISREGGWTGCRNTLVRFQSHRD